MECAERREAGCGPARTCTTSSALPPSSCTTTSRSGLSRCVSTDSPTPIVAAFDAALRGRTDGIDARVRDGTRAAKAGGGREGVGRVMGSSLG